MGRGEGRWGEGRWGEREGRGNDIRSKGMDGSLEEVNVYGHTYVHTYIHTCMYVCTCE